MSTTTHFYSVKGGSGCTTQAVLFTLGLEGSVFLWDRAGGDAHLALGLPLLDDSQEFSPGKRVGLPWMPPVGFDHLVVDHGIGAQNRDLTGGEAVLVIRNDYPSLRAALNPDLTVTPDRVIVLAEPGGALRQRDVEAALASQVSWVERDPRIARAVDAGLLARRPVVTA